MVSVVHSVAAQSDFAQFFSVLSAGLTAAESERLNDAVTYAWEIYGDRLLGSGEGVWRHALGMALILVGLKLDADCRLAALLWIMAAAFTRNDAKGAWRIWRRDRRNHASPNSAQTESACAGALGVQLAGPAYYFGEYYPKPTIGDPLRPIEPEDILRADRMMYAASGLALAFGSAIRGFLG